MSTYSNNEECRDITKNKASPYEECHIRKSDKMSLRKHEFWVNKEKWKMSMQPWLEGPRRKPIIHKNQGYQTREKQSKWGRESQCYTSSSLVSSIALSSEWVTPTHAWVDPPVYTQGRMDGKQMSCLNGRKWSLSEPPLLFGRECQRPSPWSPRPTIRECRSQAWTPLCPHHTLGQPEPSGLSQPPAPSQRKY